MLDFFFLLQNLPREMEQFEFTEVHIEIAVYSVSLLSTNAKNCYCQIDWDELVRRRELL
jgi:hypothetical protein